MLRDIELLDTTLRDGAQGAGVSFSLSDRQAIARSLHRLGVGLIEAGNPSACGDETVFFDAADEAIKPSLVAFGATRRKGGTAEADPGVQALLAAGTPTVSVFGKAWDAQASDVLRVSTAENLAMIADTVAVLAHAKRRVLFDAEHFFDGYIANADYALAVLDAAYCAGADTLVLCDTNGGRLPHEVAEATAAVAARFGCRIGAHMHNDCGLAVANTLAAVEAGATHVQGTLTGLGERCGNANLSTVVALLETKYQCRCLPEGQLANLTPTCRLIFEVCNTAPDDRMPYVGAHAFTHKAGMHVDGVSKSRTSFEHIDPQSVGNERNLLLSTLSGQSAVRAKLAALFPGHERDEALVKRLATACKGEDGLRFEGADATFMLMVESLLDKRRAPFSVEFFKIMSERQTLNNGNDTSAMVKVRVGDRTELASAEGDGPVNALDSALRRALSVFFPNLDAMRLTDYKVRVIDSKQATAARVRVLIESSDGSRFWRTAGVNSNIISASFDALLDSVVWYLTRERVG